MKKVLQIFSIILFAAACNSAPKKNDSQKINESDTSMVAVQQKNSVPVYTPAMLDSKKDLVCGMPVTEGISDTAHYKGKVYGFCSKECKEEFIKTPVQYLSVK